MHGGYHIAPFMSRIKVDATLTQNFQELNAGLKWSDQTVNLKSCEQDGYMYFRIRLQQYSGSTYAGYSNGSPFPLPRTSNANGKVDPLETKRRVYFLRHWVRRVSDVEIERAAPRELTLKHIAVAVSGEIMLIRVDIDRDLTVADTFKSVSFAAWMFQVVQLDAVIDGLPNIRFAFAIERTVTHDERALIESQHPNATAVPTSRGPRPLNVGTVQRGRSLGPRHIAARPEEPGIRAKLNAPADKAPSARAIIAPSRAPPSAPVLPTTLPSTTQVPSTIAQASGNSANRTALPSADASPRNEQLESGPQLKTAPEISSKGAIAEGAPSPASAIVSEGGMVPNISRPVASKQNLGKSSKVSGRADTARNGRSPQPNPSGQPGPASKRPRASENPYRANQTASADCGAVPNGLVGSATPHHGLSGNTTIGRHNAGALPDISLKQPPNSHLALWASRDPSDPYEPFFVTDDHGYHTRANKSYIVRSLTDATTRYHHLRLRAFPGSTLAAEFADGPDLESVESREGSIVLTLPAKRARGDKDNNTDIHGCENGGVNFEDDGAELCETGYISAVKAAARYNSTMQTERREFAQWYIADSLVSKERKIRESRPGDDDSSSSG
jgi:hypothetical protein